MRTSKHLRTAVALLCAWLPACQPFANIFASSVEGLLRGPARLPRRVTEARRPDARLAVLWVGHATVLVQIEDRFVLTDPVFTDTVGQVSPRLVEPGIAAEDLPALDVCVISHMHFDHLSYGSLERIETRVAQLLVPRGGLVYVPRQRFPSDEVAPMQSHERGDLRITAVPVRHVGYRYGVDAEWMVEGHTGWMIEHDGVRVFFAGDTAYDRDAFLRIRERFDPIDVALLPIGPIEPDAMMRETHLDGPQALDALEDLGARLMIPIHHSTFAHGAEPPERALELLRQAIDERRLDPARVRVLAIGEQAVLIPRTEVRAGERGLRPWSRRASRAAAR